MKKSDINRVLRLVEEFEEDSVHFLQDMIKARSENPLERRQKRLGRQKVELEKY